MLVTAARASTSRILLVAIKDSSSAPVTTLTSSSSGLVIDTLVVPGESSFTSYTSAGSTIETIATIGTYAAPSASNRCRFGHVGKGLYMIYLRDERFAVSGAQVVAVLVSGVSGMLQVEILAQLEPVPADLRQANGTNITASGGRMEVNVTQFGGSNGTFASGIPAVSLTSAAVQSIWDALTSALSTANSIGKLLVDNINATISSRLASGSYSAPPSAASIRTEMDSNSTKLASIDGKTSQLTFTVTNKLDANTTHHAGQAVELSGDNRLVVDTRKIWDDASAAYVGCAFVTSELGSMALITMNVGRFDEDSGNKTRFVINQPSAKEIIETQSDGSGGYNGFLSTYARKFYNGGSPAYDSFPSNFANLAIDNTTGGVYARYYWDNTLNGFYDFPPYLTNMYVDSINGAVKAVTAGGDAIATSSDVGLITEKLPTTTIASAADTQAAKLASDGLDAISTTQPTGVPTNFREWIMLLIMRFFNKVIHNKTAETLVIRNAADNANVTTQSLAEVSNVQTQGPAT